MATSQYFSNYSLTDTEEIRLIEDNLVECIQIMGKDVYYLPRENYSDTPDNILGETAQSKFTKAIGMEMYPANVEGYEGDGEFFSKFGLEIRESGSFVVAARTFRKYVDGRLRTRPQEGDLIFAPSLKKFFEIKFVEEELLFFTLGKPDPYAYELRCEVFRYSNENFITGNPTIDAIQTDHSYAVQITLESGSGNYFLGESVYQGANLASANAVAMVKNWIPETRILEVVNIKGEFSNTSNIIGVSSGTQYMVEESDTLVMPIKYDDSDNKELETTANDFIVMTENPFGKP